MSFGGPAYTVSPDDFQQASLESDLCMGAFFALETSGSTPAWIVGDTFLKNVYSVFRFNPPSVGFATLSSTATAENGVNGAAPSPTIGSAAAAVSATGANSADREKNAAGRAVSVPSLALATVALLAGAWLF
jgi:cathepsin D